MNWLARNLCGQLNLLIASVPTIVVILIIRHYWASPTNSKSDFTKRDDSSETKETTTSNPSNNGISGDGDASSTSSSLSTTEVFPESPVEEFIDVEDLVKKFWDFSETLGDSNKKGQLGDSTGPASFEIKSIVECTVRLLDEE
ncbi:hypothetical protein JCM33374_g28 [Metschnikowia sp. JCM 33374]|nr:hypothetical protein JCM33374_g28 [Metschnikowia sp. JCM 33374]